MSSEKETGVEGKLVPKDYSKCTTRRLNRNLRLRERQIAAAEAGAPTSSKSLNQLKYERETIMNTLLERAMTE